MTQRLSKQERRQQIAEAAIDLIGEYGLREFTAAHIAEMVGIRDGTIFRHFKDKREIMIAALDRIEQIMLDSAAPLLQAVAEAEGQDDPLQRLRGFMLARVELLTKRPGMFAIIFSDQLAHAIGPEAVQRVRGFRQQGREMMYASLQQAQQQGLIRPELDLDSVNMLLHGLVISLIYNQRDGLLQGPVREAAEKNLDNLLQMLRGNKND